LDCRPFELQIYVKLLTTRYVNNLYNNHIDASICLRELDPNWNISWPLATRGQVVIQKCPGGAESVGMY